MCILNVEQRDNETCSNTRVMCIRRVLINCCKCLALTVSMERVDNPQAEIGSKPAHTCSCPHRGEDAGGQPDGRQRRPLRPWHDNVEIEEQQECEESK